MMIHSSEADALKDLLFWISVQNRLERTPKQPEVVLDRLQEVETRLNTCSGREFMSLLLTAKKAGLVLRLY